ncbi:MAG TPA: EthD domain-containing protein [Candidatus Binatia bacterium]|nr:EthD domain-containing protein [Candidatus Binatia bacterium]
MRKLVFLCRRRPDIDHRRYVERLLEGHVPIALRHHPTMRKYVVNVVDRVHVPGSAELDSVGELSFETLADYRERLYDSAEGQRIVGEDVAGFIGGVHAYECTEHVQKAPAAAPARLRERSPVVKMIAAVKRRAGLSHDEFARHWLERHVPLALEHHVGLVKYVTNVVDSRISPDGEDFDGIAELHFATEEDLRTRMFGSDEGRRAIEADIPRFLGPMQAWLASEYVCKLP